MRRLRRRPMSREWAIAGDEATCDTEAKGSETSAARGEGGEGLRKMLLETTTNLRNVHAFVTACEGVKGCKRLSGED